MTPQQFGQLALQILAAAQIPGEALETALAFKSMATDLVQGRLTISEPVPVMPDAPTK